MAKFWFQCVPRLYNPLSSEERESSSDVNLKQRDGHQTLNCIMTAKKNPSTAFKPPFGTNADEHHIRLGEHAQRLWKHSMMTDVVVKLEGKEYPCHKTVLSCYSKFFKECLEENRVVKVINLRMSSVSKTAFEALLTYMYTSDLNLTCQNIGEVYTASRRLGVDGALLLCTNILSGKSKHDVYAVYVYVTAKKLQLEGCAAKAMKIMTKRFEHIAGTPEFLDLDFFQVREYLSQEVLATRSEVIVFLAAMKWLHVKFLEREQYAADLIECVRFPMMTLNEILACFSPPLLPGILELKKIKDQMLEATCFVAAALINEEKRFERYFCRPRKYLLKREQTILWDTSIFDAERHKIYKMEMAATKIQAAFRGYKVRKNIEEGGKTTSCPEGSEEFFFSSTSTSENGEVPKKNNKEQKKNGDNKLQNCDENKNDLRSETDEHNEGFFSSRKKSKLSHSSSIESLVDCVNDIAEKTVVKVFKSDSVVDLNRELFQNFLSRTETIHKTYKKPCAGYDKDPTHQTFSSTCHENLASKEKVKGYNLPDEESTSSTSENTESIDKSADYILVTGGYRANDIEDDLDGKMILVYNVAKKKWANYGAMMEGRHHHRLVLLNDVVYFIGGCNLEKTKSGKMAPDKNCYKFNLKSRRWSKIRKMTHSRMYHGAAEIDGKIYVVGGKDKKNMLLRSIEVYSPETNEWEELDEILETPTMGSGVCAHQGKIWIIGGMTEKREDTLLLLDTVQYYDPNKKRLYSQKIRELPSPRAFLTVASLDTGLYVIGGITEDDESPEKQLTSISDILLYNKREKRWILAATLPSPRHFVNANVVGSFLYILGGFTTYQRPNIDEVIVYEENTGKWSHGASLPKPLCGFASVSIPGTSHN